MNRHLALAVIAVLCLGLLCSDPSLNNQAQAQGKAASAEGKITVFSPMGTPPPIKLKPMAPRLTTLDGKTIYVIDQGYLGTDITALEACVTIAPSGSTSGGSRIERQ